MARTDLLSPHEKTTSPVAKAAVTVRACLLPLEDYNPCMRYVQKNQILGVSSYNSGHVGPLCSHQDPEQTASSTQNNRPGLPIYFSVVPFSLVSPHPFFFNYVSHVSTSVCGD